MENTREKETSLISLHGGHSSGFCLHAWDPLEKIIQRYIELGYSKVGITEHMPPPENGKRYPDEVEAGIDAAVMQEKFERYFETVRRLSQEYSDKIRIFAGFETEWYSGALSNIRSCVEQYRPDYLVGSVHHVEDIPFDYDEEHYIEASAKVGGIDDLYLNYFDEQYEMLASISPFVVGHFDLIRKFDSDYMLRLKKPEIVRRIRRNLELIQSRNLVLDLNTRALKNGSEEPYPTRPIMDMAREMGIRMVPSDDSHGVDSVGFGIERAIHLLKRHGFETDWHWVEQEIKTQNLKSL